MNETEALAAAVVSQKRKELKLAEDFLAMIRNSSSGEPDGNGANPQEYAGYKALVLHSFDLCPDEFTALDVMRALEKQKSDVPRNAVSLILKRLREKGQIQLVKKGGGRQPSTYKRF